MSESRKLLVVTGDDFGFSHGVNEAILRAHKEGILTSASLMVSGDAYPEAVDYARSNPSLGVGLHLVVGCGRSVLVHRDIPHLVNKRGEFSSYLVAAGLRYQFSAAARRELKKEIQAQLEKFRRTNLPLSHVDGHHHMHLHPVVLEILIGFAREYDIRCIRLPSEEWGAIFKRLRRYGEKKCAAAGIDFPEEVYGLLRSGQVTEEYLLGLIPQLTSSRVEIYSHPALEKEGESRNGPHGSGESELAALLSPRVRAA